MPTIIAFHDVGGVLHLPVALQRFPEARLVCYNRVSTWSNAGPGKHLLEEKTAALYRAVRQITDRRSHHIEHGIEPGQVTISGWRPCLRRAATEARQCGAILVTMDLSRFIRAMAYSRTQNRNAWPTAAEFAKLHELTLGVPLATVESPQLSESQRHSLATKRSGRAGRPRIPYELAAEIFTAVDMIYVSDGGRVEWIPSLRKLARAFGVSATTITRLVYRPVQSDGVTWWDLFHPTCKSVHNGFAYYPSKCVPKRQ